LAIAETVDSAPPSFQVFVEGLDCDCGEPGGLGIPEGGFTYDHGVTWDYDWATATSPVQLMPTIDGSGDWSATTSAYAVKFSVHGTWTVSYSP
ncbi:MAG: hypothetical protein JWM47_1256, partial [Acidimicrobiales bacterium]|nr:hypothetical protein [Acidimicrobiales bacterium]